MEHSLHLAAGHVLSHITPVQTEQMRGARKDDENDETSVGEECSAIISHGLRKMLGLINQVYIICRICICYIH